MKLSVILIAYNMQREIPRTLQSLAPSYQQGMEEVDYEVLVLDNNSSEPLDEPRAGFRGKEAERGGNP